MVINLLTPEAGYIRYIIIEQSVRYKERRRK